MRTYTPDGAVLSLFIVDNARVRVCRGPVGCLSGRTEFLTPDGWKRIDAYADGDLVGIWAEDGRLFFDRPKRFIDAPASSLIRFSSKNALCMEVSDDHRVPTYDWRGRFQVMRADALEKKPSKRRIPINFRPDGQGCAMSDAELRLMVALSADGYWPKGRKTIDVGLRKERKKERLRALLRECGVSWTERTAKGRPTETCFALARDGREKGCIFWNASPRQLEIIIDECVKWDGYSKCGESRFYTTRKDEADFIQYAAHACGGRASIRAYDDPRNSDWATNYTVHIAQSWSRKSVVGLRGDHTTIERIEAERQYCFETATGFFLARCDGKIFVTGNSGKSVAAWIALWRHACEQAKGPDGKRKSRWLITRSTYPALEDTTLNTHLEWFPELEFGKLRRSRPFRRTMIDGDVEAELIFMALEGPEDVEKLKSLEITGAYVNEAQFMGLEMFADILDRCGRYPRFDPDSGEPGSTWNGIIADMNAPPHAHWAPIMCNEAPIPPWLPAEERMKYERPKDWKFYIQPPGLIETKGPTGKIAYRENPRAENKKYHKDPDYYQNKIAGKTKVWIDTNVMNRPAAETSGKPIYPMFSRVTHVFPELLANDQCPLLVGLDYGRTPAAVFSQRIRDRWMFLSELYMEDIGASTFAPMVKRHIAEFFPWAMAPSGPGVRFWGDPAGMQGTQAGEITPQQVFHMNGLMVRPAMGAIRQKSRKEPVEKLLMELSLEGGPRFLVSESCTMLVGGLQGGYHWKEVKGNRQATSEEPEKTPESHICEAMEYVVYGEGEGRNLLLGGKRPGVQDGRSRNNPLTGKPRPAALFKQRERSFM